MKQQSMAIRDMPQCERPREKIKKYGAGALADEELLALILRTGRKGESVVALARRVVCDRGLDNLARGDLKAFESINGIGQVKACELLACVEIGRRIFEKKVVRIAQLLSPRDVFDGMRDIRDNKKEHFIVFFLDTRNQVIQREIVSVGTINASLVHPREVFEPAVRHLSVQVILAHNHPSGDLEPSDEDCAVTRRLVTAGKILGIDVIDHIIVTRSAFVSFKEKGLM